MLSNKNVIVMGGDKRFSALYEILKEKCKRCVMLNTDSDVFLSKEFLKSFDVIILPLPLSRDGVFVNSMNEKFRLKVSDVIACMRHDALFFAGIISDSIESELIKREVNYYDYYKNKQFLILNSHLTALAAIKLISPDDETRYINKNVLITGYGYLAQALANCCDELGMNVSLIARKPKNRADAQEHGFDVYDFPIYEDMLKKFDYIFNTVPSKIFSKENISRLNRDTVFVELASKPYGTDPSYFISFSKEYICAQSLPGKYYPKECAKGIFDALINHLTNDGDEH